MRIREINTMRGPNYWSIRRHKLIVMVLDLESLEQKPTNSIPGFLQRLQTLLPGMYEHRCSVGSPGGFYQRVEEGTWMGHVIEHIALEIQSLAGMEVGFGRTRSYGEEGVYHVVFDYIEEKVGQFAARSAVRIAQALVDGADYDLAADIQEMRELREANRLGPSTGSIIEEAEMRGIPWIRLNKYSLCQLGYGRNQKRVQATVTSQTSSIGVELAGDKEDTKYLLQQAEIPVPRGEIIRTEAGLDDAIRSLGFPLVIKPIDGNHGRGVTTNIEDREQAIKALENAKRISSSVIVEQYITGEDYRILVINYRMVAAAKRLPAQVTGDGLHSVRALIDQVNADPRRGYGHEKVLTSINVDTITMKQLEAQQLDLDAIPEAGRTVVLKDTANLSTGGTSVDVTDMVHPSIVFMAERISRVIGLDICGIDFITRDISKPVSETRGAVIEVNAGPGFRMHLAPAEGLPRNVAAPVIDMLYPPGTPSRIPIVAVTGTNGKTTTTRLMAHLAKLMGYTVGYTTTDGIYIQNHLMMSGDCSGPGSAEFVLKDPTVNFAVLETARGGILRAGLGFRNCDIAIVTNIAPDHLGLKGIHTIEQLAKVKSVVVESVLPEGYAILNADDDLVYDMRSGVHCNIALFSMDEQNERIRRHMRNGGLSALYENGYITICKGEWKMRIVKAVNVPLTYGGKASFMIQNVLPVALAGYLRGFALQDISSALESFIPSPAQTPGRLNLFNFKNFDVMLDYAHNPAGLNALKKLTDKMDGHPKIGIIAGIGDRRPEDNEGIGYVASTMFDEVIIRQDKNLRGRSEKEIIDMLMKGIHAYDPNKKVSVYRTESEAITASIENAVKGSLIVICSDVVPDALEQVQRYKEEEVSRLYEFTKADIPNQ
ncbi:MAG: cyanophycin synthetase [Saprospiraceae bacterium]|nr:cyanophycin synthetase [Saprospiraceae bacterium]HMW38805.1 cyanophycin synthetase [Saprospiraceae bacterium]HMX88914.1 cyanophycin synthetase [Saprospiraceae bacterium]HMZ40319.1 cyanophycin synthetase [Saprospiraceae bacterium]HNA63327.1 cyanophycin synthetase [Saprospiraceae bacterium]